MRPRYCAKGFDSQWPHSSDRSVADSDEVARAFRDDVGGSARDRTAFRPRRSSTAGLLAAGWARAKGHSHRRRRGQRDLPKKWPRHFPNTLHVVGYFSSSLAEKRVYRRPATVKRPRRKPAGAEFEARP